MDKDLLIHDLCNALHLVDLSAQSLDENLDAVRRIRAVVEKSRARIGMFTGARPRCPVTDVGKAATEVARDVAPLAVSRGVTVLCSAPGPGEPRLFTRVPCIDHVIENLVTNAVQHGPDSGTVELRVRAAGAETLEITVRDSGPGPGTRSPGAGLQAVRRLLAQHGLSLVITSDAGGTVARVVVPRRTLTRRRVLVIDDDADVAGSLVHMLRTRGHSARASAGKDLGAEDWGSVDVVILDYALADGSCGADILVAHGKSGPAFAVLTGMSDIPPAQFERLGAAATFYKPLPVDDILNFVGYF